LTNKLFDDLVIDDSSPSGLFGDLDVPEGFRTSIPAPKPGMLESLRDIDLQPADVAPHDIGVPLEAGRALAGGAIGFGLDLIGTPATVGYGSGVDPYLKPLMTKARPPQVRGKTMIGELLGGDLDKWRKGIAEKIFGPDRPLTPDQLEKFGWDKYTDPKGIAERTGKRLGYWRQALQFLSQPEGISPGAEGVMEPALKGIHALENVLTPFQPVTEADPGFVDQPFFGIPGPDAVLEHFTKEWGSPNLGEVARLTYILGLFKGAHLTLGRTKAFLKDIPAEQVKPAVKGAADIDPEGVAKLATELEAEGDTTIRVALEEKRVEDAQRTNVEAQEHMQRVQEMKSQLNKFTTPPRPEPKPKPKAPAKEPVTLVQKPSVPAVRPEPTPVEKIPDVKKPEVDPLVEQGKGLTYETEVRAEETGETYKVSRDAGEVLEELNLKRRDYRILRECLGL